MRQSNAGIANAELEQLTQAATVAAADTVVALAAERARDAVALADGDEAKRLAGYWSTKWLAIGADRIASLREDLTYQVQWALADVDGLYVPHLDDEFLADAQQHGRNFALARMGHPSAFDWVEPDHERRQKLLEEAWRHSSITPYIDEEGQVRLFATSAEQRAAERLRDAPAPADVAPAPSEVAAVLWRSEPRRSSVVRGIRDIWRRLS
jgi:hypothetical protein